MTCPRGGGTLWRPRRWESREEREIAVSLAADFMEQNNWANLQIIEFCEGLDEALLDATAAGV